MDWATGNRYLPAGSTERPGMWRPDFMPYLIEIQENLHPDSPVRITTVIKSTQSGVTTGVENAIGHSIKYGLHNILYVISDLDMAKLRSSGAIDLLIDFCGLADCIKPITKRSEQRKSGDTVLYKEIFAGRRFLMTSYNSIAKLKSFSWDFIIMDELTEAPFELADQGDPEAIIEARGKTIRDLKVVKLSTPSASGTCRITKAFSSGDRREYMVPCPRCGGYQHLEFMHSNRQWGLYGDYDFDKRGKGSLVPGTARYKCRHCDRDFFEYEKNDFMRCIDLGGPAYWEPQTTPQDSRDRSYHISAMMSPMTNWDNIVTDYLKADMGKNLQAMRNFVITNEGMHPETDRRMVLWDELRARAEEYPVKMVPSGPYIITGGADVHKNRVELVLTAWGPGMEAWIFDHEVFFGQTADINSPAWNNLLAYCDGDFYVPGLGGITVGIVRIAVDSSYNPNRDATLKNQELRSEVNTAIQFCATNSDVFVPVKGIEEGKSAGFTLTQRTHKTYGCEFYLTDVGAIKDVIFQNIDVSEGKDAVHFSKDFPEDFFRQFASEYYGEDEKGKVGWHKLNERNETLDCFVYSRAAAMIMGYHLWDDDDWLYFRDQILRE
ncbi:MAG: phage terminase large subunit family protein [Treponema sp.]|nr:phage terminase large subunit family protein [Treponema sp.]